MVVVSCTESNRSCRELYKDEAYGTKKRIFALKSILERETDDTHGITMERILQILKNEYGIEAERKSIYDDLYVLRDSEILEVSPPQGKNREYFVTDRTFELPEIKMIIDSIQSSKFLSEKRSRELIQKMETLCSRHESQLLTREVVLANRVKSTNRQIYINIDHLHSAISHNSMITFRYFAYDMNKDKAYMKKGENYTASPWKMVYVDENYYLLAYESGRFKHFRVDKMENVTELNMPREGGDASGNLDMSDYNKHIFGMYGGEVVPVTMVFLFKMMGAVMDKFGHDIMIMKEDEKHFRITVPVAVSQQFFGWVFGFGKMARIVAPESVKQKMKTMLTEIAQKYEDE